MKNQCTIPATCPPRSPKPWPFKVPIETNIINGTVVNAVSPKREIHPRPPSPLPPIPDSTAYPQPSGDNTYETVSLHETMYLKLKEDVEGREWRL